MVAVGIIKNISGVREDIFSNLSQFIGNEKAYKVALNVPNGATVNMISDWDILNKYLKELSNIDNTFIENIYNDGTSASVPYIFRVVSIRIEVRYVYVIYAPKGYSTLSPNEKSKYIHKLRFETSLKKKGVGDLMAEEIANSIDLDRQYKITVVRDKDEMSKHLYLPNNEEVTIVSPLPCTRQGNTVFTSKNVVTISTASSVKPLFDTKKNLCLIIKGGDSHECDDLIIYIP